MEGSQATAMKTPKTLTIALLTTGLLLGAALGTVMAQDPAGEEVTPPADNTTSNDNRTTPVDPPADNATGGDGTGETPAEDGNATDTTPPAGNATDTDGDATPPAPENESEARHSELWNARKAALASFHENRSRILGEYHDALAAIRESYLENKSAVIEACRSDDANKTNATAFAHCIRDGLRPLKEQARADMREAREDAHEALKDFRGHAIAKFHADKTHIDARHHRGSHADEAGAPADPSGGRRHEH